MHFLKFGCQYHPIHAGDLVTDRNISSSAADLYLLALQLYRVHSLTSKTARYSLTFMVCVFSQAWFLVFL